MKKSERAEALIGSMSPWQGREIGLCGSFMALEGGGGFALANL